jgi:aldehyde dehydrogenase (NAD+)
MRFELERRFDAFIDGRYQPSTTGRYTASIDPAKGTSWAEVADGTAEDVDMAVSAAARAFSDDRWSGLSPSQRGRLLSKLGDLLEQHAGELAEIETRDNGKAIRQTRGEMSILPQWYWYFGGAADKIEGSYVPLTETLVAELHHEPIGVVGAITPFNSPLLLAAWKLAPALAAGNTVVLKPAPETPVTSLLLAELAIEAGFPDGVLNVMPGGDDAGRALVSHPDVGKIAFTGESGTAKAIGAAAAASMKRVSLEGGGKSPHIVFEDANLDQALIAAAAGVFISAGQTCVAGSRLLVARPIFDEFVGRLAEKANSLAVGDPLLESTDVGALTSERQWKKVAHYVELAQQEGAHVLAGGVVPLEMVDSGGFFFRPTVLVDVRNEMRVCQEEIFGPVVACLAFDGEKEAVALANGVPYGLGAGVWTNDIRRAYRVAKALRAGTVWVNNYRTIHWAAPFGGVKQSGYGRENGLIALCEYLQPKTVLVDHAINTPDPFGPR